MVKLLQYLSQTLRTISVEKILCQLEKFEMYRVIDDTIHTVLPWHGWYLCCFVAKSVQLQYTLFCRKTFFFAIYALFSCASSSTLYPCD